MPSIYRLQHPAILFLGLSAFFALAYSINNMLTSFLLLVPGAHLVHIPSGLKLLMVLVCGWSAALAIGMVSFVAGFFFFFEGKILISTELAFANAVAPLLTHRFFIDHFSLDADLGNLNWQRIWGLCLLYASINSAMIQLIIYYNQPTIDLLNGLLVSWVGDITGILIVLYLCRKLALRLIKLLPTH